MINLNQEKKNLEEYINIQYGTKIKRKNHSLLWKLFHKTISFIHKVITLGGSKSHYENFVTVMFNTIWIPDNWTVESIPYSTLRHEVSHVDYMFTGEPDMMSTYMTDLRSASPFSLKNKKKSLFYTVSWSLMYLFSRKFRSKVEFWGYLQNIRFYIWKDFELYPFSRMKYYEEIFHGPSYLWMNSEEKARKIVKEMYIKAKKESIENKIEDKLFLKK